MQNIREKIKPTLNKILSILLLLGIAFSVITIINAAAPDPGHTWSEIGDVVATTTQGGTGLTSAGAIGNVLTSDGSIWTSAAPTTTLPTLTLTTNNTSTAVAPSKNTLYANNIIKGYVGVTGGATPAIGDSFNVSSITDGGVGTFTVNWLVPFTKTSYAVAGISNNVTDEGYVSVRGAAGTGTLVGSVLITTTEDTGAAVDATYWSIMAAGQQ